MQLNGKKILLGVTASIAAYKAVELCRLLTKEGADVKVIMTPASHDFITPLTFSVISKNQVFSSLISDTQTWNNHVELGLWADLLVIAPATANTLAKMAYGLCDNLLTAVYLSTRCQTFIAPAMDHDMYAHSSTGMNLHLLRNRGHQIIGPSKGELASGLFGDGRMEDPSIILSSIINFFFESRPLKGKKVLVTAGPTQESIDPVRFISNHSSGKMGFAIASELVNNGAEVTLIAGPNHLQIPEGLTLISVTSAQDMRDACMNYFNQSDIVVMSAAVADFTPDQVAAHKIKKNNALPVITLKPTVDILDEMGKQKSHQYLVGFALESTDAVNYGKEKLKRKNLDLVIINSLEDKGAGFNTDTNKITMIDSEGIVEQFELKSKKNVARDIVNKIMLKNV